MQFIFNTINRIDISSTLERTKRFTANMRTAHIQQAIVIYFTKHFQYGVDTMRKSVDAVLL